LDKTQSAQKSGEEIEEAFIRTESRREAIGKKRRPAVSEPCRQYARGERQERAKGAEALTER
jgi:hypothetical protein